MSRKDSSKDDYQIHSTDIAIIGMAGTFPGASNIETYWQNLLANEESVKFLGENRKFDDGKKWVNAKPMIENVDCFDAPFFKISAKDAALMDPQHRLLLQSAWNTFENAGYLPENIDGKAGVFLASNFNTYQHLEGWLSHLWQDVKGDYSKRFSAYTGNIVDTISSRISYKFGLKGPSLSVHSACSSSLVALHLACQSILLEESDIALVGACALSFPDAQGYMCEEGMILSPDGHCRPFDQASGGTVFGNGVATVLLKPLDQAIRDKDSIDAVIKGSAINNDGSDKVDFLAPSIQGQCEVIEKALEVSGVHPDSIGYIEAHGTGTRVGDPIEIAALTKAYQKKTDRKNYCGIGSVKSNIGHLDAASGMASLVKAVLCVKYGMIPATLHFQKANPNLQLDNSPFYILSENRAWEEDGHLRRCGVTSLGIGGTNSHVILEQLHPSMIQEVKISEQDESIPLLLSAESQGQLETLIGQFNVQDGSILEVAHTLIVGRRVHRYCFVTFAKSTSEIPQALKNGVVIDGIEEDHIAEMLKSGFPDISSQTIQFIESWIKGQKTSFSLFNNEKIGRVHLPGYPFAKKRYWYDQVVADIESANGLLHPLIQKNISTLEQQKFSTVLMGKESFLRDHKIRDRSLLPAAAYLEMARSALCLSYDREGPVCIKDVFFDAPISLDGKAKKVETALCETSKGAEFFIENIGNSMTCCHGKVEWLEGVEPQSWDNGQIEKGADWLLGLDEIYARYRLGGTLYGKTFQSLQSIYLKRGEKQVQLFGKISLNENVLGENMVFPPALLDAAFQPAIGLSELPEYPFSQKDAFVPVTIKQVDLYKKPTVENTVVLSIDLDQLKQGGDFLFYDSSIFNDRWELVAKLTGVKEQRLEEIQVSRSASTASSWTEVNPFFKKWFSKELGISEDFLDLDEELEVLGLDSMMAISLTNKLENVFGPLSKTLFFEYRTLGAIAQYLSKTFPEKLDKIAEKPSSAIRTKPALAKRTRRQRSEQRDVAIVGLAGRYPQSDDLNRFWEALKNGSNLITEVPKDRWEHEQIFSEKEGEIGKTFSKWGGFLNEIDHFDPLFFKIAPSEAMAMDPQERLFLQTAWETLEDAGYTPASLSKRYNHDIGVYAGAMYVEYQLYSIEERLKENFTVLNGIISSIANRASFLLDFRGPSLSVDTMCSSSLTALYLAFRDICCGKTRAALVGGVNLTIHPNKYLQLAQERMLSKKGLCESFGNGGSGYVPSEGVGCVLLKPLDDAIEDRDQIYGVLKAVEINHGGKTNSFTVPNVSAQSEVIRKALDASGISADTIGYIEAHGTGTKLGDPIEIQGLSKAFAMDTDQKQFCKIGSLKSNMGHAEAAAGIAGLTKVLLQFRHKMLVPSIHSENLNPEIPFAKTPFVVQKELEPWLPVEEGLPRRAGLSSFGAGGANAHVIIEEFFDTNCPISSENSEQLLILSAKNLDRLKAYAQKWVSFLEEEDFSNRSLEQIAYTLAVGRVSMESKIAFVCNSLEQWVSLLKDFIQGHQTRYFISEPKTKKQKQDTEVEKALERRNLQALAKLYCEHEVIDWMSLYEGKSLRKISLPTYPFAQERCWFLPAPAPDTKGRLKLHPLIDENVSVLEETRFLSRLSVKDPLVIDHQIGNVCLLPGSAYLEIALSCGELALGEKPQGITEVRWFRPIYFDSHDRDVFTSIVETSHGKGFEIWSPNIQGDNNPEKRVVFCQGYFAFGGNNAESFIDLAEVQSNLKTGVPGRKCYEKFKEFDFQYGPSYQTIQQAVQKEEDLWICAKLPKNLKFDSFTLHPVIIDAAFQSTIVFDFDPGNKGEDTYVPYGIQSLNVYRDLTQTVYIQAQEKKNGETENRSYDLKVFDDMGHLCVELSGFSEKKLNKKANVTTAAKETNLQKGTIYSALRWKASTSPSVKKRDIQKKILLVPSQYQDRLQHLNEIVLPIGLERTAMDTIEEFIEVFFSIRDQIKRQRDISIVLLADHSQLQEISPYLGYFKTLMLEKASTSAKILLITDLEKNAKNEELAKVVESEWASFDPMVRYDQSLQHREEFVLEPIEINQNHNTPLIKKGGVYWCLGGSGGIGFQIARAIALKKIPCTLIMSGRAAASKETQQLMQELGSDQFQIDYIRCDVTDFISVKACLAKILSKHGMPNGVIHAAGLTRDSLLINKTEDELRAVMFPKILGTSHLTEALQNIELDYFLLFSSDSSIVGNVGQTDYASANSYLDFFADYREKLRKAGLHSGLTKVINWPYWEEGGMRISEPIQKMLYDEMGVYPLPTNIAIQSLEAILNTDHTQVMVSYGDLQAMHQKIFNQAREQNQVIGPKQDEGFVQLVKTYVQKFLEKELHLEPGKLEEDSEFEDFGVDSIVSMNLISAFESQLGSLPKTLFFEYLTFAELIGYLADEKQAQFRQMFGQNEKKNQPPKAEVNKSSSSLVRSFVQRESIPKTNQSEDIAIIGISGRYPESENLDEFWKNLYEAKNCIREIPKERWEMEEFFSGKERAVGKSRSKWGGFIKNIDRFDPLFFKIAVQEAQRLDPQEKLLLEEAYHAIEDAGYTRSALASREVGVYVGSMYQEYQLYNSEQTLLGNPLTLNGVPANLSNRISYFFDLRGPSLTLDTMCSSSLTAMYLAYRDILDGTCEMALVAGVNVNVHPNKYLVLSDENFVSTDGLCKSFGEGGDGYVPSEGCGVCLLKPLAKAMEDRDRIHGVIKGIKINHGGKSKSFTVPSARAQSEIIEKTLATADVSPSDITYIEAHGTGTSLGDPIEISGLSKAFRNVDLNSNQSIPIGSVKSNIGHCEAASGMAGLTKVLLQMNHEMLVPSIHSEKLNPNIDFDEVPFNVQQKLEKWNGKKRALISSFGAGGSNGCLIVESFESTWKDEPGIQTPYVFVLSAKTEDRLKEYASNMLEYLKTHQVSAQRLAYTLQVGRMPMEKRLGIVFHDIGDLCQKLEGFLGEDSSINGVFTGHIGIYKEIFQTKESEEVFQKFLEKQVEEKRLVSLVEFWVKGIDIPWSDCYRADHPPIMSLPGYPFAKQLCWFENKKERLTLNSSHQDHPFVHRNTSSFSRFCFSSRFDGTEIVLAEHVLAKVPTLPGAVSIEVMARAGSIVLGEENVSLDSLIWLKPIQLREGNLDLEIHCLPKGEQKGEIQITDLKGEIYAEAQVQAMTLKPPLPVEIASVLASCEQTVSRKDLYRVFSENGLTFGQAFQRLEDLHIGQGFWLAMLTQSSFASKTLQFDPYLVDAAFQSTIVLSHQNNTSVPFMIEKIAGSTRDQDIAYIYGTVEKLGEVNQVDLYLLKEDGSVAVWVKGFQDRPIKTSKMALSDISIEDKLTELLKQTESSQISIEQAEILANALVLRGEKE